MTAAALRGEQVRIESGWGQGRATFGGLVAALLIARMRGLLDDPAPPLRTVTTMLVAPIAPGPVEIHAQVLRRGRSVVLVEATLLQDGQPGATAQAAFAAGRASSIVIPPGAGLTRPSWPAPEALPGMQTALELAPEFLGQVDLRPATGHPPFSGAATPDFGGWMRYREPIADPAVEHVVGLIDAWPPAMAPMLPGPKPLSTLAWTVELFVDDFSGTDFWQYLVRTDACLDGYGHSAAQIWNGDGALSAISRQTIAVFG